MNDIKSSVKKSLEKIRGFNRIRDLRGTVACGGVCCDAS